MILILICCFHKIFVVFCLSICFNMIFSRWFVSFPSCVAFQKFFNKIYIYIYICCFSHATIYNIIFSPNSSFINPITFLMDNSLFILKYNIFKYQILFSYLLQCLHKFFFVSIETIKIFVFMFIFMFYIAIPKQMHYCFTEVLYFKA